jgi:hypothetical protein
MSEVPLVTANIIPFSTRRHSRGSDDGQERLRRALIGLDEALAGQRAAVAAWRSALSELSAVVSRLGESLQYCRGSLDTLGTGVARLHAEAVQLERTADGLATGGAKAAPRLR